MWGKGVSQPQTLWTGHSRWRKHFSCVRERKKKKKYWKHVKVTWQAYIYLWIDMPWWGSLDLTMWSWIPFLQIPELIILDTNHTHTLLSITMSFHRPAPSTLSIKVQKWHNILKEVKLHPKTMEKCSWNGFEMDWKTLRLHLFSLLMFFPGLKPNSWHVHYKLVPAPLLRWWKCHNKKNSQMTNKTRTTFYFYVYIVIWHQCSIAEFFCPILNPCNSPFLSINWSTLSNGGCIMVSNM